MADRHRRAFWVDVDRGHVQADLRFHRKQVELGDAGDVDARTAIKVQVNPVGIDPQRQSERFSAIQGDVYAIRGHGHREREGHPAAALHHAVVGPDDARADDIPLSAQHGLLTTGKCSFSLVVRGGEEAERSLASAKVGNAHAGQQEAAEGNGRKGDRHALDDRGDVLFPEHAPEGLTLLKELELRSFQRNHVLADVQHALGALDVRARQDRGVGARVAGDEVEDAVAGRVHTGCKR